MAVSSPDRQLFTDHSDGCMNQQWSPAGINLFIRRPYQLGLLSGGDEAQIDRFALMERMAIKLMHGTSQHGGKKSPWGNLKTVYTSKPDIHVPPVCSTIGQNPSVVMHPACPR